CSDSCEDEKLKAAHSSTPSPKASSEHEIGSDKDSNDEVVLESLYESQGGSSFLDVGQSAKNLEQDLSPTPNGLHPTCDSKAANDSGST
ncbi:hypothetical protein Tco_1571854, partial [Tanacetum coccineum]